MFNKNPFQKTEPAKFATPINNTKLDKIDQIRKQMNGDLFPTTSEPTMPEMNEPQSPNPQNNEINVRMQSIRNFNNNLNQQ